MSNKKTNYVAIMMVYLLGVFMGSIDTGIVTPARTVIQGYFGADATLGIWMITIYTLAYAASIPIMGKLADKHGRKPIFLISIALFGLGSLCCGLSEYTDNFYILLGCRALQAIGGGGILPIANAEFGTTFPPEKRGMALGLVGGIYGIANIIGSSLGSAIMTAFGADHWSFIFYINVPITIIILVVGILCLPNNKDQSTKKTDYWGAFLLVIIILLLMYGLRNLDFFNFTSSISSLSVWPFFVAGLILCPLFIFVEHRAEDPMMNLSYFKNRNICLVLIMSIVTGIIMMGMVFVPQFAENALGLPSGSGGYFVLVLGLVSGIGAPLSGVLIDRIGVKPVIGGGFVISAIGGLFLAFVTAATPSMLTIIIGLILAGAGLGLVMGTPLNYMMMENTDEAEANSALATLSLVRSFGTVIAPAIMVGFISHAGISFQNQVMDFMPNTIDYTNSPYVVQLNKELSTFGSNFDLNKMTGGSFSLTEPMTIDMSATDDSMTLPHDAVERLQNSDVTNITENCEYLAAILFDDMSASMQSQVEAQVDNAITQVESMQTMMAARGIPGVDVTATLNALVDLRDNLASVFNTAKANYLAAIQSNGPIIESTFQATLNEGFQQIYLTIAISSLVGFILLIPYRKKKRPATTSD